MSDTDILPTFVKIELLDNSQHKGGPIWINIDSIIAIYPTETITNSQVHNVWIITVNLGSAVTSYVTSTLPSLLAELLSS